MSSKIEVPLEYSAYPDYESVVQPVVKPDPLVTIFCHFYGNSSLNFEDIPRKAAHIGRTFKGRERRIFWDESIGTSRKDSENITRSVASDGLLAHTLRRVGIPQLRKDLIFAPLFDRCSSRKPIEYQLEHHTDSSSRQLTVSSLNIRSLRARVLTTWRNGDIAGCRRSAEPTFLAINHLMDLRTPGNMWQFKDIVAEALRFRIPTGIFINHRGPKVNLAVRLSEEFKDDPRVEVLGYLACDMEHLRELYQDLSINPSREKRVFLNAFLHYLTLTFLELKNDQDPFITQNFSQFSREVVEFWQSVDSVEIHDLCQQKKDLIDFIQGHPVVSKFPTLTLGLLSN